MKKLLISASIAAVFALSGCGGGDDLGQIQANTVRDKPASRIVFDPAAGVLNVPTDLLFALVEQTDDGTLEMPDEIAGQANGGTPDFGEPGVALGALDGWSTQHPFTFSTSHAAGVSLDAASASAPGAVRLFQGALGGNLNDPDCAFAQPLAGCKIYEELTFGVDFVTTARGNDVAVVPLKPLPGSNQYFVVVTDQLRDSDGRAIKPSTSYELLRQDINSAPLATESQLALQGLINSFEGVVAQQGGLDLDSVIFTYPFTVQSTTEIINTVKQLQIAPFATALGQGADLATAAQFLPAVVVNEADAPNAMEKLGLLSDEIVAGAVMAGIAQLPPEAAPLIPLIEATDFSALSTCDGLLGTLTDQLAPVWGATNDFAKGLAGQLFNPQVAPFCAADLKQGSINLPYYLSTTEPLTDRWRAACTNGLAMLALGSEGAANLVAAGATGPYNGLCQAATQNAAIQLLDLDLSAVGINDLRHVTRYSPIPAPRGTNPDGTETLDVQITVPDETVANVIIASNPELGLSPISKPESGWPVVVLQHGITSKKEDFLAISGTLSLAGFATVAIDHPLHGSRGFVVDGEVVNASGGFGGSTTDYMNLASLLTTRDNLRQSIVDTMGLRLGLNAVVDLTGSADLDGNNVSFIGQSLGSISGIGTVAMSNQSLGDVLGAFDGMYEFKSAVFSVPGGGIAGFLIESPAFSNLIKGSLLAAASEDFQQFLAGYMQQTGQTDPAAALAPAYVEFEKILNEAQLAEINALFAEFVFAAQTVTDAGDPNNFAAILGENTPVLVHEVVGGGENDDMTVALSDQVIPNTTVNSPTFAGTEPLAAFIGLPGVSTTTPASQGIVRFTAGSHSSLLSPAASARATAEMQRQAAAFIASQGTVIVVTDNGVVQ